MVGELEALESMIAGRSGTPSQGRIFLIFEGGATDPHGGVQVVSFNLSWLLAGRDVAPLLENPQAVERNP